MASASNNSVLIVDNCLHAMGKGSRSVGEDLATRLSGAGWMVRLTSGNRSRILRLLDMVGTAWSLRTGYRVAIVHVFSGPAFRWAEAVCWTLRRCGKPYVLTLHGGNLPSFCKAHENRARRLLNSAAAVVAPSGYLQQQLREYTPNIGVLPNGLDTAQFTYVHRLAAAPRLVWVRAFHSIYNPVLAVEALDLVHRSHPSATLTMIGRDKRDGSLASTRRRASELGIEGQLRIVPGVDKADIPTWLQQGDIFLNTANVDNTPLSVLEAMGSGLCVVTTRVGGIPFLLQDGENALIVPAGDPSAMAQAIDRLLAERGLAGRLSEAGYQKARTFDWSTVIPQWISLLYGLETPRLSLRTTALAELP